MILRGLVFFLGWCAAAECYAHPLLPRPEHVVIVIEENKPFSTIVGNPSAPYINQLASRGVLFTASYGVTHPSQPNYLALFSGSTHGIRSNICPLELSGSNLALELAGKGKSFASYSESMPYSGFEGCVSGSYFRKHNPAANWKGLNQFNLAFTSFPQDPGELPTVALVDAWLSRNIEPYVKWAMTHDSLLIVTWDEDDGSSNNRIATIFVGPMVNPGVSGQHINHYSTLRTLEEMYGLPYVGESASVTAVEGIWADE
jgi:hypothetical protein